MTARLPEIESLLRPPPGESAVPSFAFGWNRGDGVNACYLKYTEPLGVNWSAELEALHEESSRDHPIDIATRRALVEGVSGMLGERSAVVDIGCSSGYLLEDLRRARPDATLYGVDVIAAGLERAHRLVPSAALVLADAVDLPFEDGALDAAVSGNVLEHLSDDLGALRELHRVLRPGGRAAIVVPAGPGLYDYYDAFLGHARRYGRGELAGRAREAGFTVMREAFVGSLPYPAFWLVKKVNRLRHRHLSPKRVEALVRRDVERTGRSRALAIALAAEARMGRPLPAGIRSLVVLERGCA
jgi:SAM-dependent methyltransferase